MWYYDIGARVKAGAVLAKIDTPDLDQQFEQAKGQLAKAQADYNLAVLTADRWKALRQSQAVSQQTTDEKAGDAKARQAEVSAAQANVDRYRSMMNFKDIVAPFDGIVTARRIDVGALVSASNNNEPRLFDVASTKDMRIYIRVPQVYAASMHKGLKVTLKLPQYSDRTFTGVLDTTSDAISQQSRALLVEALFKNPEGLLTPGAYAQAKFALPLDPDKLVIPAGALIFRDTSPEVAIVKDAKVVLKPISILLDTGSEIEVGLRSLRRRQDRRQSVGFDFERRRCEDRPHRRQEGRQGRRAGEGHARGYRMRRGLRFGVLAPALFLCACDLAPPGRSRAVADGRPVLPFTTNRQSDHRTYRSFPLTGPSHYGNNELEVQATYEIATRRP